MVTHRRVVLCLVWAFTFAVVAADADVPLPAGVKAVWGLEHAAREKTPTRERVCLNGLWRWQPGGEGKENVPAGSWGFFKVPGAWPGINDYMQKDSQTLFAHPTWKSEKLGELTSAWYQREFSVPAEWAGKRIVLKTEYLNSLATVFVDGKKAGELHFPRGEVELTTFCKPGEKHVLSMLVAALPLKGVMLSYTDSASARTVKGKVNRRGLCGDVWLESTPNGAGAKPEGGFFDDVNVTTSFRKGEISVRATLNGLAALPDSSLRVDILEQGKVVKQLSSPKFNFTTRDFKSPNSYTFTAQWKPEKLWDIHTPQNQFEASVSVVDGAGKVLDTALPVRFGFRELWIDGRDFYLNGSRIFLSAVPLDNAEVGAAAATYEATKESLLRLKSIGINFVYTHNYGCDPGSHLGFNEILRAADDVGVLVSLSQPHFSHYDWKAENAEASNNYERHAQFYTHVAGSHPSVVFYSMNHNSTGYNEDMNPDMIDGLKDPRPEGWSKNNSKQALRAEAIVHKLDASRIIYHHASGDLGSMWNSNFYPNMVPIQELSDWFEHWSQKGVKPAFTCEYGAPFTWDWSMYRGWFKGKREFGSAAVQWEFCFAEWNAQFLGDRAFALSEFEKANLRFEANKFKGGGVWHRWDYPNEIGSNKFDDRHDVLSRYITDNWRSFRTWGLSANSPWEHGHFWRLKDSVNRERKELSVDWENLQRPGYSPDFIERPYERMDLAYAKSDWVETASAKALIKSNQPLLAYIGGKAAAVTSKDHNFLSDEAVEKELIVINNSRETVTCDCSWMVGGVAKPADEKRLTLATGMQERIPINYKGSDFLNVNGIPGILAVAKFSTGETQQDFFAVHVVAAPPAVNAGGKVALFDPKGETAKFLDAAGAKYEKVESNSDLSAYEVLIIGKNALSLDGAGPKVERVRDGLKVICFEQNSEVLEKRLGFRVNEYGLRQVFKREPEHALLAGLEPKHLRDWRGESTLLPGKLRYETGQKFNGAPFVKWCGIDVTRLWRCGNRGNVASALIEKPARGNFLPVLDGGFSLQYAPLMEYREGKGMVVLCQMDATGRSENDPAGETLARNILNYAGTWKAAPARRAIYVGDASGKTWLANSGIETGEFAGKLTADDVLVVAPGGGEKLSGAREQIAAWLKAGGNLLAIGLDEAEANSFLPAKVSMKKAEHIVANFEPAKIPLLAGVGAADTHTREPRTMPLVTGGAKVIGDGVLAKAEDANVVFCQIAPWTFDYAKQYNLKRAFRRSSCLVTRLLGNMGVNGATPLLERISKPVDVAKEKRWLEGFYLDVPEEMDDPYRFFRW